MVSEKKEIQLMCRRFQFVQNIRKIMADTIILTTNFVYKFQFYRLLTPQSEIIFTILLSTTSYYVYVDDLKPLFVGS